MEFIDQRQQRLAQLRCLRPEYGEIFDFYGHLFKFLATQQQPFLSLAPSSGQPAAQPKAGFPMLHAANLQVDRSRALGFLAGLLAVLQQHGRQGQEELKRLDQALQSGRLDPQPLLGAYLERNRLRLTKVAEELEVAPALLEYVIGLACSFALQQARAVGLRPAAGDWTQGYCPLCGGSPVMGELVGEEGRMALHCGTCGESWPAARRTCSGCGNHDETTLEYFTADGDPAYRVNVCRQCSSYLKVLDSRLLGQGLPMDLEDLATIHLDLLAQGEGFTRGKQSPHPDGPGC